MVQYVWYVLLRILLLLHATFQAAFKDKTREQEFNFKPVSSCPALVAVWTPFRHETNSAQASHLPEGCHRLSPIEQHEVLLCPSRAVSCDSTSRDCACLQVVEVSRSNHNRIAT